MGTAVVTINIITRRSPITCNVLTCLSLNLSSVYRSTSDVLPTHPSPNSTTLKLCEVVVLRTAVGLCDESPAIICVLEPKRDVVYIWTQSDGTYPSSAYADGFNSCAAHVASTLFSANDGRYVVSGRVPTEKYIRHRRTKTTLHLARVGPNHLPSVRNNGEHKTQKKKSTHTRRRRDVIE